jgi:hypothetical protein
MHPSQNHARSPDLSFIFGPYEVSDDEDFDETPLP